MVRPGFCLGEEAVTGRVGSKESRPCADGAQGPQLCTAGLACHGGPQEDLRSHQEPFWLSASPNFPVIKAQPPKLPDPRWGPWTRLWSGTLPLPEPGLTTAPKQASAFPQTRQQSPSQPSWRLLVTRAWTPLTSASISPPHALHKPSGREIRSREPRQVFW